MKKVDEKMAAREKMRNADGKLVGKDGKVIENESFHDIDENGGKGISNKKGGLISNRKGGNINGDDED